MTVRALIRKARSSVTKLRSKAAQIELRLVELQALRGELEAELAEIRDDVLDVDDDEYERMDDDDQEALSIAEEIVLPPEDALDGVIQVLNEDWDEKLTKLETEIDNLEATL